MSIAIDQVSDLILKYYAFDLPYGGQNGCSCMQEQQIGQRNGV
jgi:hypothetical protein